MNLVTTLRTIAIAAALCTAGLAQAATVSYFSDDFENGLGKWTDRNPGNPDGVVVADPLRAGNNVLSFRTRWFAGSLFSKDAVTSTGLFTLSFDYLGLARPGSVAGDLGGYIGVASNTLPGLLQYYIGGTQNSFLGQTPVNLIDDGRWRSYAFTFNAPLWVGSPMKVVVEDWLGSLGVPRDAYFDNIVLRDNRVPEPGSLALVGLAMAGMGVVSARRKAAASRNA